MITRRASRLGRGGLLGVVLLTATTWSGMARADHAAYSSPERKLGYSACGWPAGREVTVGVDPAFPFPDPSFSSRLDESIARWNQVLRTATRGIGLVRAGGANADVVVQYRPTGTADDHGVLAETFLQRQGDPDLSPNIGRCPDRRPVSNVMKAVQIRINPRTDWFTGPDSSTSTWQMCSDSGFRSANTELCADEVDFASTVVHELGHALVLYHPQTLDDIDGVPVESPTSASTAAKCVEATGSFGAQATMCAGQGVWRAEQRDLETWDVDTTHKHYS